MSRKRKKKNWADEDYYDSDDDTFLDRTGTVEKKRQGRMKKAGKLEERPDTYESLVGILHVSMGTDAAVSLFLLGLRPRRGCTHHDLLRLEETSLPEQCDFTE